MKTEKDNVESVMAVTGFSLSGTGQKHRYGLCEAQRLERKTES